MSSSEEPTSLEAFLASVEKRAYRMAQIATGDSEEAFDIVQDAMLKLVRHYRHKPPRQWRPLFYRVLHNHINDHHRRARRRTGWLGWLMGPDEEGNDPVDTLPDRAPAIGDQLKARGALGALEQVVARLPRRQQQALMLRLWEGLDVAETARAMGCTQGSVKTHYARAIAKLREELGEHWP